MSELLVELKYALAYDVFVFGLDGVLAGGNRLNFDESIDIYKDIISGFKDGEDRPNFSILMAKLELGEYQQVLFSEFSRLERKPTNLLRDLEKFQSLGVYAWFSKQNLCVNNDSYPGSDVPAFSKSSPIWDV